MSIDYTAYAGYGIIIDDENVGKFGAALDDLDMSTWEIAENLYSKFDMNVLGLDSEYVGDSWSGSGNPGIFIASRKSIMRGGPRELDAGLYKIVPPHESDHSLHKIEEWLYLNKVSFTKGFFLDGV